MGGVAHSRTKAKGGLKQSMLQNRASTLREVNKLEEVKLMLMASGSKLVGQFVEDQMAPPPPDKNRSLV